MHPIWYLGRLRSKIRFSSRPRPQRFGQLVHHAIKLAAQQFVKLFGAAIGGEGVVDEGVVQHQFVAQLFAQAV